MRRLGPFVMASFALAGCLEVSEESTTPQEQPAEVTMAEESALIEEDTTPEPEAAPTQEPRFGVDPVAVRIGLNGPNFDACGSYGQITGLDPDGDNFLSVRAAPTTDADELDRLGSGTGISLCDSADGWIGIVYEESGAGGGACGVGSPVSSERDYDGPCRSGWVSERFVEVIAG